MQAQYLMVAALIIVFLLSAAAQFTERADTVALLYVLMFAVIGVGAAQEPDTGAGDDKLAAIAGGLHESVDPALETQSVDDYQPGLTEAPRVGRAGLESVRIAVFADE